MNEVIRSAVVHAEALGKTYAEGKLRTPVFDGLELNVQPGETVALGDPTPLSVVVGRVDATEVTVRGKAFDLVVDVSLTKGLDEGRRLANRFILPARLGRQRFGLRDFHGGDHAELEPQWH